jgi:hypothetical protein
MLEPGGLRRLVAVGACALVMSCGTVRLERKVGPTLQDVDATAPYLKVHLRNGDVYVLSRWTLDGPPRTITGTGEHWGPDRTLRDAGATRHRIELRDVAVFETNTPYASPMNRRMRVLTGVSVTLTVIVAAVLAVFTIGLLKSFSHDT